MAPDEGLSPRIQMREAHTRRETPHPSRRGALRTGKSLGLLQRIFARQSSDRVRRLGV